MLHEQARRLVVEAARELPRLGLTVGNSGNVSARVPDPKRLVLAITPHGGYGDSLGAADVLLVDSEGEPLEGDGIPSVELGLHVAIYTARPGVAAIIHAHPPLASAVSVLRRPIPPLLEDQVLYLGGQIEVAPPALSGSGDLATGALAALGEHNACLLANHGAVTVGKDMRAALHACQYLEKAALAYVVGSLLGGADPLSGSLLEMATAFFRAR